MKEKNINNLFLVLASAIAVITAVFIVIDLRGYLIYEKLSTDKIPEIKTERIHYYDNAIFLISKAIQLDKLNADYPAFKADLLSGSLGENLKAAPDAQRKEIEKLYMKAISLNPVNFEYHLKLGWFYAQIDDPKAESEMQKAIELYPSYYRNYLYFSKYYLKNKKEKKAFSNILLTFYRAGAGMWRKIMPEINDDLKSLPAFYFDEKKRQLSFSVAQPGEEFNFKKSGFPHINAPLKIKVFMPSLAAPEVVLYKNNILYGNFKKTASLGEANVYEFNIEPAADVYLDELTVKTTPSQVIEKIEFVQIFR